MSETYSYTPEKGQTTALRELLGTESKNDNFCLTTQSLKVLGRLSQKVGQKLQTK